MGFAEFLNRKVVRTFAGGILSTLWIKRRRNTLFFEDIYAGYVRECQEQGFGNKIEEIGEKWGALIISQLMPEAIKKVPLVAMNLVMREVWLSYGLLDDQYLSREGEMLRLEVENEGVSRVIGSNLLILGAYKGVLGALFNSRIEALEVNQGKERSSYLFRITGEPFEVSGKERAKYLMLNKIPEMSPGYDLGEALKAKIFVLKDNKIYFRGRCLPTLENTLLHLFANRGLLMEEVPVISYNYFRDIVTEDSTEEERLALMKSLFQAMGLGLFRILTEAGQINVQIRYPPYGLQAEEDNWGFLSSVILGYLWLIDRNMRITCVRKGHKALNVEYAPRDNRE